MTSLDWLVIGGYLVAMLALALYLGRRQASRSDYYLGANKLPGWALATSIVATQCSTNSLLGAPAFVGFVLGGGMLWLQYEIAVPLAMLALCFLFIPVRNAGVISIYAYLEQRLGLATRLLASACFLFFRGVATGVTVYGVASVIGLVTGTSYTTAVLILMGITVVYDTLGGMRAVVVSDVVQMLLLGAAVLYTLWGLAPGLVADYPNLADRTATLVNDWGLSGNHYGFWPMLFGGLFLYVAYYGCDQSQAQRLLAAKDAEAARRILALNGVLRFPLVLAYCLVGLGLAAYAAGQPEFVPGLPRAADGSPNFNLVFPAYVAREFAPGLAGLAIVGLFAAAMSSIDSALNSLSASSVEDFVARFRQLGERQLFIASKLATVFWGAFAVVFSYQVERIAPTVLEAINKVGSMANGPLLALFCAAAFFPRVGQFGAIAGFSLGLVANLLAWVLLPSVSWLWWNPLGFGVACLCGLALSALRPPEAYPAPETVAFPRRQVLQLLAMAAAILATCLLFEYAD